MPTKPCDISYSQGHGVSGRYGTTSLFDVRSRPPGRAKGWQSALPEASESSSFGSVLRLSPSSLGFALAH